MQCIISTTILFYAKYKKVDKDQNLIETDLIIDSAISMHLRETAVWGKFLSIIGFVYCGLIALGAIFAASFFAEAYLRRDKNA